MAVGMVIGTVLVLIYVIMGGSLAVAYTDFIQMIVLVIGLSYIAWVSADLAGGTDKVFELAIQRRSSTSAGIERPRMDVLISQRRSRDAFGSVPQQDVFQRVMSAKEAPTARNGAVIGGLCYLAFAFVPMFIVTSSLLIMPDVAEPLLQSESDSQKVLPKMILERMPFFAQVLFFGALVRQSNPAPRRRCCTCDQFRRKRFCVTCGRRWMIAIYCRPCVFRFSYLQLRCLPTRSSAKARRSTRWSLMRTR